MQKNIEEARSNFHSFYTGIVSRFQTNKVKKMLDRFSRQKASVDMTVEDLLGRKVFAKEIAQKIEKEHQQKSHTILAISAKWGSGKTWLLDNIRPELINRGFYVVTFNAWHYSQEQISLKRSFLRTLNTGLKSKVKLDDLYQDTTSVGINFKIIIGLLVCIVALFFLPITIDLTTRRFSPEYSSGPSSFVKKTLDSWEWFYRESIQPYTFVKSSMVAVLAVPLLALISKIFSFEKSTAKITEADEFEDKFKKIIGRRKKVVIFVDDLDRCTPDAVKKILDALTTFFEHDDCSFIVTGDHTVIERYVGSNLFVEPEYDGDGVENRRSLSSRQRNEGRRFLKKIFNVYWQLPSPDPNAFKRYAIKKVQGSGLDLQADEQKQLGELLSTFLDKNLREVIRFVDALVFTINTIKNMIEEKSLVIKNLELEKVEKKVAENEIKNLQTVLQQPILLAKTLLIQELFYPIYEEHVQHHTDIILQEKALRNTQKLDTMFGKRISELFFDPQQQTQYIELIKSEPKFTDENNSTKFDPDIFWYLSGVTGLPSNRGPDADRFLQLIKLPDGHTEIEKDLSNASNDTKKRLLDITKEFLGSVADLADKQNASANSLQLALVVFTWSEVSTFLTKLFKKENFVNTLEVSARESLLTDLFSLCFKHNTDSDAIFADEFFSTPEMVKYKWLALDQSKEYLHSDVIEKLSQIIRAEIGNATIPVEETLKNLKKLAKRTNPDDNTAIAQVDDCLKDVVNFAYTQADLAVFIKIMVEVVDIDSKKTLVNHCNQKERDLLNSEQWINSLARLKVLPTNLQEYYGSENLSQHVETYTQKLLKQSFSTWSTIILQMLEEKDLLTEKLHLDITETLLGVIKTGEASVKLDASMYLRQNYSKMKLKQSHILELVNLTKNEPDHTLIANLLYVVDDFAVQIKGHQTERNILKQFSKSQNAEVKDFADSILSQITPKRKNHTVSMEALETDSNTTS